MQPRDHTHQVQRETVDAGEAAGITGLSEWTIYDLARRQLIPHIRIGLESSSGGPACLPGWTGSKQTPLGNRGNQKRS